MTILVPTYNRAGSLDLLLGTLRRELAGHEASVDVIVGDNASTDETPVVSRRFEGAYPAARIMRHAVNLGPEENFCQCLDGVRTRFFWIIGDDDLPKANVIGKVIEFLADKEPDLLYISSEWVPEISGAASVASVAAVDRLDSCPLSRRQFAAYVNVWTTFISGMIVNIQRLRELHPDLDIRSYKGTQLVQLGWVLPLLMRGSRFYAVPQRCVLATSGNSGGYRLVEVFATNFPRILDEVCGAASPERKAIVSALVWNYVPGILWMARFGAAGQFTREDIGRSLQPIGKTLGYRVLVFPIAKLPRWMAFPFWMVSRTVGKWIRALFILKVLFSR